MKLPALVLGLMSVTTLAAEANSEWFKKIPSYLSWGNHLGKREGLLAGRCLVNISPSDKDGVLGVIKKTKLTDIIGGGDVTLGSLHILPTDTLIGSSRYPEGPFASDTVLAMGFELDGRRKSLILEKLRGKKVRVTIEEVTDRVKSSTCIVEND